MTLYDEAKEKAGPTPAYPNKTDFETIYGYAGGKTLGTFPTRDAAKKAGAVTSERVFDREGYEAAKQPYIDHNSAVMGMWMASLRAQHSDVNDKVFALLYGAAYDRGHSYGYNEVELYIDDYIDLAKKIIEASKETIDG